MKLFSSDLEKVIIKLIATLPEKFGFYILSKITVNDFAYDPARECYKRIKAVLKTQDNIPSYTEIINDPAIAESTRELFQGFNKTRNIKSKTEIDGLIKRLSIYRKTRDIINMCQDTAKTLKDEDKVDIEALIGSMNNCLTKVMLNREEAFDFLHLGEGDNSKAFIKQILTEDASMRGIPTGFKVWDDINGVVPFGSAFIIAATTGGLKTTLALQLCRNFAEAGARCCYVSLEMPKREITQRRLSNLSHVSMTKVTNPNRLTKAEMDKITQASEAYSKRIKRKGGLETFMCSKGEVTDDEVLFKVSSLNYKVVFIDYVGLLKGTGAEDQWRVLGDMVRKFKIWAVANDKIIVVLAQLDSNTNAIRYSRAMQEHANLMWSWNRDQKAKEIHIISIRQDKARNQRDFPFQLMENADIMTITDVPSGHEPPKAHESRDTTKRNSKNASAQKSQKDPYLHDV